MIDLHPTKCNLCGGRVDFVNNAEIYGRSLGSGKAYLCRQCGAYVGTHRPRPTEAYGILANSRMRLGKRLCHALFDSLWKGPNQRRKLYRKLAREMHIKESECHFGYFDLAQLRQAYRILKLWTQLGVR